MDDDLRNKCIEMYGDRFSAWYDRIQNGLPLGSISRTVDVIQKIEQAKRVVEAERINTWKKTRSYLLITNN